MYNMDILYTIKNGKRSGKVYRLGNRWFAETSNGSKMTFNLIEDAIDFIQGVKIQGSLNQYIKLTEHEIKELMRGPVYDDQESLS